jgi:hypothetical protein
MPRLDGSAFADAMADAQRKAGGGVRQRRHRTTDREAALDAAAQAEYLAQQLRAIAEAAALPPPEAFAPSLDPSELPEPPPDELPWEPFELDQTVDEAISSLEIAPEALSAPIPAVQTTLARRSASQTRPDMAVRMPGYPLSTSEWREEPLETLKTLSKTLVTMRNHKWNWRSQ